MIISNGKSDLEHADSDVASLLELISELESELAEAERLLLLFPPHFYNTTEVGDWLERRKVKT